MQIQFKGDLLGAVKGNYQGADYYTLTIRTEEGVVADITGKGDFDFLPFLDKACSFVLDAGKSNGRFKFRVQSATEAVKPVK